MSSKSYSVYMITHRPGLSDWNGWGGRWSSLTNNPMPAAVKTKIGFSQKVQARLSVIACQLRIRPLDLRIEHTIKCRDRRTAFLLEKHWLTRFADKRRPEPEWFNLTEEDIRLFVESDSD
jgi:hypothetical protein